MTGLPEGSETVDGGFDGVRGGLTQTADRGVFHDLPDVTQHQHVSFADDGRVPVVGDPLQRLLLTHGAHPAGHALTTGLVAEEACDA